MTAHSRIRRPPPPRAAVLIALVGWLAVAGSARAAPAPFRKPAGTFGFRVRVIAASPAPGPIDPRLATLMKRLHDFSFKSYKLLTENVFSLRLSTGERITLPDNRVLDLSPRRVERSGRIRVRLRIWSAQRRNLVDAEYAIRPGGDLVVGGMRYGSGSLIVAVHHLPAP